MSARATGLSATAILAASVALACGATSASPSPRGDAPRSSASATIAALSSSATAPSSSAPAASATPAAVVAAPPPRVDPNAITVTTVKVPASITLDGDPSEWGALDVLPGVARGAAPQKPGLSHVAFALDNNAIHLVGSIAGEAKSGLTIALRFEGSEVPYIGYAQRGGGFRSIGDCSEEIEGQTPPIAECKAIYAAYDAFKAAHAARFMRVFRVTSGGISADGAALAKLVASGTFKSKSTPTGFTFEAELPVAALPRVAEAPVSSVDLAAVPGASPPPSEAFFNADFAPVTFEPSGALRKYAFERARMGIVDPIVVSYQPGDWNKIEVVHHDDSGLSLEASERALFTKLGEQGDVQVGYIHVGAPIVILVQAGVPSAMTCFMREAPRKALTKKLGGVDGWLMVTSYDMFRSDMGYGRYAGFDTCFWGANGTLRSGFWQEPQGVTWDKVTPTISSDYETLALAGTAYPLDLGSKPTVTMRSAAHVWRLDKTTGVYSESP